MSAATSTATRQLTSDERMAIALARRIENGDTVATGLMTPVATMAALIARDSHAPNADYLNVPGGGEVKGMLNVSSMECTALIEQGAMDVFFFTPIQVEPGGDFNLQYLDIKGERRRLYGAWSSPVFYQMVRKIFLFRTEHSNRLLVPKLDYTSASVRDDCPGEPAIFVTSKAAFGFDKQRRRFTLDTVLDENDSHDIMNGIDFEHDVSSSLRIGIEPTEQELDALDGSVRAHLAEHYPLYAQRVYGQ